MRAKSGGVIADIEVLRALAVLIVIVGHLPWFWTAPEHEQLRSVLWAAWIGVDMFFAISGFVITLSILARGGMRGHMLSFWTRRFFRIQPLAIAWLAIGLLCTIFLNGHGFFGSLTQNLQDIAAALLQGYNVYVLYLSRVYAQATGIFGVYWSLSLEEQFYLFLPLLLLLPRRAVVAVLIAGVLIQLPLTRPPESPFWPFRFDGLFLGALLALMMQGNALERYEPKWLRGIGIAFTALVIVVLFALAFKSRSSPTAGLIAFISAALVYAASFDKGYIVGTGIARTVFTYIGSRSFGLYLSHTVCNRVATEICKTFGVIPEGYNIEFVLTALTLTFVSTECLYWCIERPFRRFGHRLADRMDKPSNLAARDDFARATGYNHLSGIAGNQPRRH